MPANPADSRNAADRVQIAPVEGGAALFTPEFRDYLVHLCDEFTARAHALRLDTFCESPCSSFLLPFYFFCILIFGLTCSICGQTVNKCNYYLLDVNLGL